MDDEDNEIYEIVFWRHPFTWMWYVNNPPVNSLCRPLDTHDGHRYWLLVDGERDTLTKLTVYRRGGRVAHVSLFYDEGVLEIGNIYIGSQHRRKGLGSALLNVIKDIARKRGAAVIEGILVERDVAPYPKLPQWYEKHGFVVRPIDHIPKGKPLDTLATIRYEMKR